MRGTLQWTADKLVTPSSTYHPVKATNKNRGKYIWNRNTRIPRNQGGSNSVNMSEYVGQVLHDKNSSPCTLLKGSGVLGRKGSKYSTAEDRHISMRSTSTAEKSAFPLTGLNHGLLVRNRLTSIQND
jgi:hypothetical protein